MNTKYLRLGAGLAALLLTLSLSACGNSTAFEPSDPDDGYTAIDEPDDGFTETNEPDSSIVPLPDAADWETQDYADEYLSYELPASWQYDENFSDESSRLAFFTPSDSASESPSNINVQVLSLKNDTRDLDFSDPDIQESFHQFLLTENLPPEAEDGTYTVYQRPDGLYVYAIDFDREMSEDMTIHQTGFYIMGLDITVSVWATDWHDNCTPALADVAHRLCATLTLV